VTGLDLSKRDGTVGGQDVRIKQDTCCIAQPLRREKDALILEAVISGEEVPSTSFDWDARSLMIP
jgi:hypothetical protein